MMFSVLLIVACLNGILADLNLLQCATKAFNGRYNIFGYYNSTCIIMRRYTYNHTKPFIVYQTKQRAQLFRIVAGTGIQVYPYFIQNVTKDTGDKWGNFKSGLWSYWDQFKPRIIDLIIKDDLNIKKVELKFQVPTSSDKSSWFDKRNLISAYPFNLDIMRSHQFHFFSIKGDNQCIRRFYITLQYEGCNKDRGYIVILNKIDKCDYFPKEGMPNILYSPSTNWSNYEIGKFFELYGYYEDNVYKFVDDG